MADALPPGAYLGPYKVTALLGRGGMGEVYEAVDTRLDRTVALKVLPPEFSSDAARRERFQREAKAISRLNHPHICTLYDVGHQEGADFLVMEFLQGETIAGRLKHGRLTPDQVLRFGIEIADALAHAHDRGIIHRDLKSANVMITPGGHAKVLDFGLASRLPEQGVSAMTQSTAPLTGEGTIAGTIGYMAPEVLDGGRADERADIWALGVVIYEMITGVLPFKGGSGFALASAILKDPLPPLPADLPLGFQTVVQLCLAKEPSQRYQTAREVSAVLVGIQSHAWRPAAVGAAPVAGPAPAPVATPAPKRRRHVRRKRIKGIAVLPLSNLTGAADQDYFVDGMTDALIADLAKIGALRVISRTSVMQYKSTRKPLPEIARELDVDAVVEGSVLRAGDRVQIRAQLIRAETDEHLWAESYERSLRDILALQREVARAIAREIKIVVTPDERARLETAPPVHPAAHELYLKGRYFEAKRTEDGFRKGIQYYQEAIAQSPGFALAHAGLAFACAIGQFYGVVAPDSVPDPTSAALRALELDASLADAWVALGLARCIAWEWPGAKDALQRGVASGAASADAHHYYALYLIMAGELDDALYEMRRARALDPLSILTNTDLGWTCYFSRRHDEAIEHLRKTIEMEPGFFEAHWALGRVYLEQRRIPDAIAAFEQAGTLSGGIPFITASLGSAYALAGNRADAMKILDDMTALPPDAAPACDIALLHSHLGDHDQAFDWLDRAYANREPWLTLAKADPRFDPLRSDPRFHDLLRRMQLEA